jgi:aerobic-type carbon monoxide dehydrogenase small subunit (CoxS/CutS family)
VIAATIGGHEEHDHVGAAMRVNGVDHDVEERDGTLLDALRAIGVRSAKDGCAPQGQCGCCTVLVDGAPRVACVTPLRRVADREITTLEGFAPEVRDRWADAFTQVGASQCGFCTPGIIVRLEGLRSRTPDAATDRIAVDRALSAHLCRCTGWQTIVEAAELVSGAGDLVGAGDRDADAGARRATMELGAPQRVGRDVALGAAGFSSDTVPEGTLVALPSRSADGPEWVTGEDVAAARVAAGVVQGRRSTLDAVPPITLPPGEWAARLQTSWVDPAYLEPDGSWCEPGGDPSSPAANGGAFGGKRTSPVPAAARGLANELGRPVEARWSREDCARRSAKRPPVAGGMRADGTGEVRVARTDGVAEAIRLAAPGVDVIEVDVAGPPTSLHLRAAGWAEGVLLSVAAGAESPLVEAVGDTVAVRQPDGGQASVEVRPGSVLVRVQAGDPLDEVVLRSYCIGAVHMALGWVCSESLTVDADGEVHDLTVRSFGVLRAADMPHVEVEVVDGEGPPLPVSDAVFVATAAAEWRRQGCPSTFPTGTLPEL